jgi:hypothetical protein
VSGQIIFSQVWLNKLGVLEMKMMRKVTPAALTVILLAALFGCMNPVDQSVTYEEPIPEGMGQVKLSVVSPNARTALPAIPAMADSYDVVFTATITAGNTKTFTGETFLGSYNLKPDTYDITLTAYPSGGGTAGTEYATGTATGVVVDLSASVSKVIPLELLDYTTTTIANGIFNYSIENLSAASGTMTITQEDIYNNSGVLTDDWAGADMNSGSIYIADSITTSASNIQLNPGLYRVELDIVYAGFHIIRHDVIYIYQNLPTTLNVIISADGVPEVQVVGIDVSAPVLTELAVSRGTSNTGGTTLSAYATAITVTTGSPAYLNLAGVSNVEWYYNGTLLTPTTGVDANNTSLYIVPGSGAFTVLTVPAVRPPLPLSVIATRTATGEVLSRTFLLTLN